MCDFALRSVVQVWENTLNQKQEQLSSGAARRDTHSRQKFNHLFGDLAQDSMRKNLGSMIKQRYKKLQCVLGWGKMEILLVVER